MKLALALATLIILGLVGCGTPTANTPNPVQNSPQTTTALAVKTADDAANTAVQTVIQLRKTGKLSNTNATQIENWLALVFNTDKAINAILVNGQPWPQQKVAILTLLGTVTAPTIATNIDPSAQVIVAQVLTLVNQIKTQVLP